MNILLIIIYKNIKIRHFRVFCVLCVLIFRKPNEIKGFQGHEAGHETGQNAGQDMNTKKY